MFCFLTFGAVSHWLLWPPRVFHIPSVWWIISLVLDWYAPRYYYMYNRGCKTSRTRFSTMYNRKIKSQVKNAVRNNSIFLFNKVLFNFNWTLSPNDGYYLNKVIYLCSNSAIYLYIHIYLSVNLINFLHIYIFSSNEIRDHTPYHLLKCGWSQMWFKSIIYNFLLILAVTNSFSDYLRHYFDFFLSYMQICYIPFSIFYNYLFDWLNFASSYFPPLKTYFNLLILKLGYSVVSLFANFAKFYNIWLLA